MGGVGGGEEGNLGPSWFEEGGKGRWFCPVSEGLVNGIFDVEALADEPAASKGRAALLLQRPKEAHAVAVGCGDGDDLCGPRRWLDLSLWEGSEGIGHSEQRGCT